MRRLCGAAAIRPDIGFQCTDEVMDRFRTDSIYTNVFKVSDVCTFAAALVNVGDVFTFTLNGPTPSQTCNTCAIVPTFPMPGNE